MIQLILPSWERLFKFSCESADGRSAAADNHFQEEDEYAEKKEKRVL